MKSPPRRIRALRRRVPPFPRYGYQPLPFPVPEDLLRIKTWKEGFAEFESYFHLTTAEAFLRFEEGCLPEFGNPSDENTFTMWISAIQFAISSGLMEAPKRS